MVALVYYKTSCRVRSYITESPKEMWDAINKVLNKGYTVTEVNIFHERSRKDYTLHFDLQGEPTLKEFSSYTAK